jgi:hypothetical protein
VTARVLTDLFGEVPEKPRAARVLRMHVVDAGDGAECVEAGVPIMAKFACHRCHSVTDWLMCTYSDAKRGVPCPKCNGDDHADQG